MVCSKCGTENETGLTYCDECGSVLTSACPSCGAANRYTAKFCGVCGTFFNGTGGRFDPAPAAAAYADVLAWLRTGSDG